MIKIWTDGAEAGFLDRLPPRGTAFTYPPLATAQRAVSVTMPVRLQSWDSSDGLLPIFEMNLPEGALRERLRLAFAKATGSFDDYDLLAIVGRSQIGRVRFTGEEDTLDEDVPFQSIDEILSSRRGGDLFRALLDRFATASGISGIQPKLMVRDQPAFAGDFPAKTRLSESWRGATHIVKFWDPNEFPHLAANEYLCLQAAERCGLETPVHRLSEDAAALVVDRFDLRPDGTYRGFEDFCVLNARPTRDKYRGSYETAVMKRFQQFANSPQVNHDLQKLFILITLNCALRNGDAHLKNFGILYDDVLGEARLAPAYDLVTTTVYLPADRMALTLNGSSAWPSAKDLTRLAQMRAGLTPANARQVLDAVAQALTDTLPEIERFIRQQPGFRAIGDAMLVAWNQGRQSLAA